MPREAKRNRPPKRLRQAKKRTNALMKGAMEAFNKRARRAHKDRRDARIQIQQMIADEKEKERLWRIAQEEKANESGILAGMLQGAGTGASIGSAIKPGWGTAIGAAAGALGGAFLGAGEGGMADVAAVSPYAAGISNLAQQYAATQGGKERYDKLLNLYQSRGAGQERQMPAPVFGGGTDGLWPTGTGAVNLPNAEGVVPGTLAADPYRYNTSARDLREAGLPYGGTTKTFQQAVTPAPTYVSDLDSSAIHAGTNRSKILDMILAGSR